MKPLNKLERQYVAYWVMNSIAKYVPGVSDNWGMDCPTDNDNKLGRLVDLKRLIVDLGKFDGERIETAE